MMIWRGSQIGGRGFDSRRLHHGICNKLRGLTFSGPVVFQAPVRP